MTNIRASLKKLIGRIKENMEMFLMTIGSVTIPLGFVVLFSGRESKDTFWLVAGLVLVLFGLMAWFVVSKIVRQREIQDAREKIYFAQQLENIRKDIVSSIKELIDEIRQDRNERNKSNSPDHNAKQ